eukprot:TRINITY_DN402_c2_g1_i4.p1 TRINITY_DN402_c2_g1~~TRINITY_DN402_c2_g1_i4.p1  ORF type:complete len:107 (+),score=10.49 TRINITY_DN402_c2_g1_i4:176-496(+)
MVATWTCDLEQHIGLGTGEAFCGTVGGRRQKFIAVLGVAMEVAARMSFDSMRANVLCYYSSAGVLPGPMGSLGVAMTQIGSFSTADGTVMYTYKLHEADLDTVSTF